MYACVRVCVRARERACLQGLLAYLLLLEPLLQQLLLSLLQNWTAQLQCLVLVELGLVGGGPLQQQAEVLQDWGRLAGLRGGLLETLDGLGCTQDALETCMGGV